MVSICERSKDSEEEEKDSLPEATSHQPQAQDSAQGKSNPKPRDQKSPCRVVLPLRGDSFLNEKLGRKEPAEEMAPDPVHAAPPRLPPR